MRANSMRYIYSLSVKNALYYRAMGNGLILGIDLHVRHYIPLYVNSEKS